MKTGKILAALMVGMGSFGVLHAAETMNAVLHWSSGDAELLRRDDARAPWPEVPAEAEALEILLLADDGGAAEWFDSQEAAEAWLEAHAGGWTRLVSYRLPLAGETESGTACFRTAVEPEAEVRCEWRPEAGERIGVKGLTLEISRGDAVGAARGKAGAEPETLEIDRTVGPARQAVLPRFPSRFASGDEPPRTPEKSAPDWSAIFLGMVAVTGAVAAFRTNHESNVRN